MLSLVGRYGNCSKAQVVRWCEGTIRLDAEAEANNGDKAIDCPGRGDGGADCSALRKRYSSNRARVAMRVRVTCPRREGGASQDRLEARLRSKADKGVTRRASVLCPRRFVLSRLGQAGLCG